MRAYAVARLFDVKMGPEIVEYLERIDSTLAPFGGHFIIHGGTPVEIEGRAEGVLIVIEFPSKESVQGWYASAAYQAILPLRTRNSRSEAFFIEGVPEDHRATDVLST